jgi:hypothetical protein
MTIAKTALPHFKPFHNSMKRFASPFPKMLFKIRMTERAPSPTLDQKKIKPDPGEENVPSPRSIAMTATKIETANQNEPLMTCFRFITLPIRSNEGLSFAAQKGIEITTLVQNKIFTTEAQRAQRKMFLFGGERPPNKNAFSPFKPAVNASLGLCGGLFDHPELLEHLFSFGPILF